MTRLLSILADGFFCLAAVFAVLSLLAVPAQYARADNCGSGHGCPPGYGCVDGSCQAYGTYTCKPTVSDDCPDFTSSTDCLAFKTCSDGVKNCSCRGEVDSVTLEFTCYCP